MVLKDQQKNTRGLFVATRWEILSHDTCCYQSLPAVKCLWQIRWHIFPSDSCAKKHIQYIEKPCKGRNCKRLIFFFHIFFFCHSDRSAAIPACSLAHRITHSNSLYSVFPPPACSAVTQAESTNPASRYSTHNHCSFPVFLWVLLLIRGCMSSLWPVIVRQNLLQITQIGDFRGWQPCICGWIMMSSQKDIKRYEREGLGIECGGGEKQARQ